MIHDLATIPIISTGINLTRSFGSAVIYNKDKTWDDRKNAVDMLGRTIHRSSNCSSLSSVRLEKLIQAAYMNYQEQLIVIALLERSYDPSSGAILLAGVDITKLQLNWLRSQMGSISQEPALFVASIKENIQFGKEMPQWKRGCYQGFKST